MIKIMEKCEINRTIYRTFPYRSATFFGKGSTLEEALDKLWDDYFRQFLSNLEIHFEEE